MVARANAHVRYPARFQLVAAMNPCRCGHRRRRARRLRRARRAARRDYQGRISGPVMDRIDLQVEVPPVTAADLALPPPAEGTAEAAARVAAARALQAERARRGGDGRRRSTPRPTGDFLRPIADLDAAGPRPAGPRRRGRRPDRPRLDPHPAPGPHHRRPGRLGRGAPRPRGRGADLPARGAAGDRPWAHRPRCRRSVARSTRRIRC